ncbi:MAG: MAPEG family protein [Pseudomonadota bacterium]
MLVIWGVQRLDFPFLPPAMALPIAFFLPGLFTAAMFAWLAQRRAIADGEPFASGSAAEVDQRVLSQTVEQLVLALAIWPFVALVLGGAIVVALGLSFALMRGLFWIGYHRSPLLRSLGFAGTFCPTVFAGIWAVLVWFV